MWFARLEQEGRKSSTSFLIVDAQSVKNTDSARDKCYVAGKKVSGTKRHIAVIAQGFVLGLTLGGRWRRELR